MVLPFFASEYFFCLFYYKSSILFRDTAATVIVWKASMPSLKSCRINLSDFFQTQKLLSRLWSLKNIFSVRLLHLHTSEKQIYFCCYVFIHTFEYNTFLICVFPGNFEKFVSVSYCSVGDEFSKYRTMDFIFFHIYRQWILTATY